MRMQHKEKQSYFRRKIGMDKKMNKQSDEAGIRTYLWLNEDQYILHGTNLIVFWGHF